MDYLFLDQEKPHRLSRDSKGRSRPRPLQEEGELKTGLTLC